jgi:hypothetical protein
MGNKIWIEEVENEFGRYRICGVAHSSSYWEEQKDELNDAAEWCDLVVHEPVFGLRGEDYKHHEWGELAYEMLSKHNKPVYNLGITDKQDTEMDTCILLTELHSPLPEYTLASLLSIGYFLTPKEKVTRRQFLKLTALGIATLASPSILSRSENKTKLRCFKKYSKIRHDMVFDFRECVVTAKANLLMKEKGCETGRRPKVTIIYGKRHVPGLQDYLLDSASLREQLQDYKYHPLVKFFEYDKVFEYLYDKHAKIWNVRTSTLDPFDFVKG